MAVATELPEMRSVDSRKGDGAGRQVEALELALVALLVDGPVLRAVLVARRDGKCLAEVGRPRLADVGPFVVRAAEEDDALCVGVGDGRVEKSGRLEDGEAHGDDVDLLVHGPLCSLELNPRRFRSTPRHGREMLLRSDSSELKRVRTLATL